MKFLPILIIVSLLFPFVAYAGFLDFLGGVLQFILCIFTGIACPDTCLKLEGPAAFRLCRLVDRIAGFLYVIGWSLALVVILWGGIMYMASGGAEDKITQAKKIIINGLIGTVIVVCSGVILSTLMYLLGPLFGYY